MHITPSVNYFILKENESSATLQGGKSTRSNDSGSDDDVVS